MTPTPAQIEAAVEAATIERCAEKIDAMIASINKGYMRPDISLAMQEMGKIRVESLQDAAAAIRALKDK